MASRRAARKSSASEIPRWNRPISDLSQESIDRSISRPVSICALGFHSATIAGMGRSPVADNAAPQIHFVAVQTLSLRALPAVKLSMEFESRKLILFCPPVRMQCQPLQDGGYHQKKQSIACHKQDLDGNNAEHPNPSPPQ